MVQAKQEANWRNDAVAFIEKRCRDYCAECEC